jgi:hypothetical protein
MERPREMGDLIVREIQLYRSTQLLCSGKPHSVICLTFSLHGAGVTHSMIIDDKCRNSKSVEKHFWLINPYRSISRCLLAKPGDRKDWCTLRRWVPDCIVQDY